MKQRGQDFNEKWNSALQLPQLTYCIVAMVDMVDAGTVDTLGMYTPSVSSFLDRMDVVESITLCGAEALAEVVSTKSTRSKLEESDGVYIPDVSLPFQRGIEILPSLLC